MACRPRNQRRLISSTIWASSTDRARRRSKSFRSRAAKKSFVSESSVLSIPVSSLACGICPRYLPPLSTLAAAARAYDEREVHGDQWPTAEEGPPDAVLSDSLQLHA